MSLYPWVPRVPGSVIAAAPSRRAPGFAAPARGTAVGAPSPGPTPADGGPPCARPLADARRPVPAASPWWRPRRRGEPVPRHAADPDRAGEEGGSSALHGVDPERKADGDAPAAPHDGAPDRPEDGDRSGAPEMGPDAGPPPAQEPEEPAEEGRAAADGPVPEAPEAADVAIVRTEPEGTPPEAGGPGVEGSEPPAVPEPQGPAEPERGEPAPQPGAPVIGRLGSDGSWAEAAIAEPPPSPFAAGHPPAPETTAGAAPPAEAAQPLRGRGRRTAPPADAPAAGPGPVAASVPTPFRGPVVPSSGAAMPVPVAPAAAGSGWRAHGAPAPVAPAEPAAGAAPPPRAPAEFAQGPLWVAVAVRFPGAGEGSGDPAAAPAPVPGAVQPADLAVPSPAAAPFRAYPFAAALLQAPPGVAGEAAQGQPAPGAAPAPTGGPGPGRPAGSAPRRGWPWSSGKAPDASGSGSGSVVAAEDGSAARSDDARPRDEGRARHQARSGRGWPGPPARRAAGTPHGDADAAGVEGAPSAGPGPNPQAAAGDRDPVGGGWPPAPAPDTAPGTGHEEQAVVEGVRLPPTAEGGHAPPPSPVLPDPDTAGALAAEADAVADPVEGAEPPAVPPSADPGPRPRRWQGPAAAAAAESSRPPKSEGALGMEVPGLVAGPGAAASAPLRGEAPAPLRLEDAPPAPIPPLASCLFRLLRRRVTISTGHHRHRGVLVAVYPGLVELVEADLRFAWIPLRAIVWIAHM